jgi:hypothetical protein
MWYLPPYSPTARGWRPGRSFLQVLVENFSAAKIACSFPVF